VSGEQAPEKTHPIAGYVFGLVLAGVLVALMGMFNGNDKAVLLVPFLLGWAVVSLVLYGRLAADEPAGTLSAGTARDGDASGHASGHVSGHASSQASGH